MDVKTSGSGDPEIAVVGAVHGDEPCGAEAIERVRTAETGLERPTKFIVANEEALQQDVRYVDVDLNRVLPGNRDAEDHERRIAARLCEEVEECITLGIHSTQSYDERFSVLSNPSDEKRKILRRMNVERAVDTTGLSEGRCVDRPRFVDVEVGPQGTDQAVAQAEECVRSFLRTVGALPGDPRASPTDYYKVTDIEEKEPGGTYEFLPRNFTEVETGDVYATKDGRKLRAEERFWPILASGDGHEKILG